MTARSDLDDLGAEEALALVNEGNGSGTGGGSGRQGDRPTAEGAAVPAPTGEGVYDVEADLPGPGTKGDLTPAPARPRATPWPQARAIAERAARQVPRTATAPVSVPLDAALGLVLAAPLAALTDLPSFDTSAMDGWAVAGPGPWDVREAGVLAGHAQPEPLTDGSAVRIATGARIPYDTTAVLRSEHGRTDDKGRLHATRDMSHGQDIRPRGQECRSGDQLLPIGTFVTPAVLGLAAAAGYDTLAAIPRPRAEVLVLGDELLTEGLPHDGLIRDALGPMLPPWLRSLGADVIAVRRLGDDAEALYAALKNSPPRSSSRLVAPPPDLSTTSTPPCTASAPNCS